MKFHYLFCLLPCLLSSPLSSQIFTCDTIYVNHLAIGANDGTSWDDAYTNLQDALSQAKNCDSFDTEIWVAQGSYLPTLNRFGNTTSITQLRTFVIDYKVKLYGGFAGHENDINQRILHLHESILSGDHFSDDIQFNNINNSNFPASSNSENSFNIMRIGSNRRIVIDGFTFSGGNANNTDDFTESNGGAIYINSSNNGSGPIDCNISRCSFLHNSALLGGGAIYNNGELHESNPTIEACIFKSNDAKNRDGGAIYNKASIFSQANPTIISSLFYNNRADNRGGAIYNLSSGGGSFSLPTIDNCTFAVNVAGIDGGAIFSFINTPGGGATPEILLKESIFYQNTANFIVNSFSGVNVGYDPTYCNFPEANAANNANNTSVDPQFVSSVNFRLNATSPLINFGDPLPVFGGSISRDLDDNNRIIDSTVDIGAYEYLSCPPSSIIYVNDDDPGGIRIGNTSISPLTSLNMALKMACDCSSEPEIRVAAGSYIPHRNDELIPQRRFNHYQIKRKLKLLGGYAEDFSNRDMILHQSTIDGDINGDGSKVNDSDNVFNLMFVEDAASGTLIEGMRFAGGVGNVNSVGFSPTYASGIHIIESSSDDFSLELKNCEFIDNKNNDSNLGTIRTSNSGTGLMELIIDSCQFINSGNCINFYPNSSNGRLRLSNSSFESGTTPSTGAVTYISSSNTDDDILISGCHFEENESANSGSCIYVDLSGTSPTTLLIEDSEFIDNVSEEGGGAVYVIAKNNCDYKLKNSFFGANTGANGGSYYYQNEYASGTNEPKIINCIFASNRAITSGSARGGAVFFNGSTTNLNPKIINSTFISNIASSSGGGVSAFIGIGTLDIQNCAFWQNTSSVGISSVNVVNTSTSDMSIDIEHSLIQEPNCNQAPFTDVNCGSGIIYAQNPLVNGFGLPLSSSPLINAGKNEYLLTELFDISGQTPRILYNSIDMGAVEVKPPCLFDIILSPSHPLFNGNNQLHGAWEAKNSITVMPGFDTSHSIWLTLDAPEVNILSEYTYDGTQFMEIRQVGCN